MNEPITRSRRGRYRRHRGLLLMLVPGLLFFLIFSYVPMTGLAIAFKEYRMSLGILQSPWCGLDNFRRLLVGGEFLQALRNTLLISVLRLGFGFFAPVILALLLNEIRVAWYKRTIQTLTYMPFFFSWVILGGILLMLFRTDGPINAVVKLFGGEPIPFLTSDGWFLFVLVTTGIWQTVGYGAVIYLAALAGINPTLYEAATVDGAGRWQQTWRITLPCLVPTMVVLLILSVGRFLSAGFDQIYNMYNPLVYDSADIIDTYVLRRLTSMDFSVATAAGMFKSVVGMMLIVVTNALARRASGGEQGIW